MKKTVRGIVYQGCVICLWATTCLAQAQFLSPQITLKANELSLVTLNIQGGKEYKINSVIMFYDSVDDTTSVEVKFSEPLIEEDTTKEVLKKIRMTALPSNTELTPSRLEGGGSRKTLTFAVSNASSLSVNDVEVKVCLTGIKFEEQSGEKSLCGQGELLRRENKERIAELKKQQLEALKSAKTSEEKNIFASGFVAKGEGKNSEGGTEIHLNSQELNIPGLTASLHLKKNTAEKADPKSFDATVTYRYTYLWGRDKLRQIKKGCVPPV